MVKTYKNKFNEKYGFSKDKSHSLIFSLFFK